jgi:hypothetical protein
VRPEARHPSTNPTVRHRPAWPNERASVPSPFLIAVDVTNTMTTRGIRMYPMVLNWRLRYAQAPSWIAAAISRILGEPWSAANTERTR